MNLKSFALFRSLLLCAAALLAVRGLAQEATLTTDARALTGNGDTITLRAAVSYPQTPGAIGWEIESTGGWELVSVGGANVPDIKPGEKTSGVLEFAYTTPPEKGATFTVTVRVPAGVTAAKISAKVLLRSDSKRTALTPAAVELARP